MRKEGAQRVWETEAPSGVQVQSPGRGSGSPQKLTLFVNECLNFDVFEEKIIKTAKYTIIKIWSAERQRPRREGPPKYAAGADQWDLVVPVR